MNKLINCKKILIEVNQKCNLNCTYCFYRDYGRKNDSLTLSKIKEMLDICPNAEEFYLTGGECFTSKNINEIIDFLSKQGKVVVFTNGVMLNFYDNNQIKNLINKVERFIITFDSYDFKDYICREKLEKTLNTIKRISEYNAEKIEVKVCITKYNYIELDEIFNKLVKMGIKYLSINFIFDIKNSDISHELFSKEELIKVFDTIEKYKQYFNSKYLKKLYELYINETISEEYPCIADNEYFYYDCSGEFQICPGNCKKIGERGDYQKCFSKECANEWEIMYER